jgi:hypothetical protein
MDTEIFNKKRIEFVKKYILMS